MADFHRHSSWGRTRRPKNLKGNTSTAQVTAPSADPSAATDGFPTENQRFLHVLLDGTTDSSTLGIQIWGWSHAFAAWGKLTDVHGNNCTIAAAASPQAYRVFEISGVDRVYLQSLGADKPVAGNDEVYAACSTF